MTVPPPFDASRLVRLPRVGAVVPSPCGTWLAVEVGRLDEEQQKHVGDLWRVPLDGGAPEPLTGGPWSDRAPCFRSDGALGFLSDRPAGREAGGRVQVWVLPARGGEPRRVTDEPLGVLSYRFAALGDRLALLAPVLLGVPHEEQRARDEELRAKGPTGLHFTEPPVRHWNRWLGGAAPHLVVCDQEGRGRRDLTPDADRELRPLHLEPELDLSADGRTAVVVRMQPGTGTEDRLEDSHLWTFDTESGQGRPVGVTPGAWTWGPLVAPDGRSIACCRLVRSRPAHGRQALVLLSLDGAGERTLGVDADLWLLPAAWAPGGESLYCTADAGGDVPVYRCDLAGGVERLTGAGSHAGVRPLPDGDALVGARHRLLHPPEPFVLRREPGASPRLLASLTGFTEQDGAAIATVERLEVPATDGASVGGLLVRPAGEGPHPTLLWIHGGPMSQWADGWHWRWCALVFAARGHAVALPNPRGSTGAGQAFLEGIWGNAWGAQCYEDVARVADALAARPDLDSGRMAAMGGSFGGYMTSFIGGSTDRFRCLVTHAGLFHLSAFWGDTDHPSWFESSIGVDPVTDAASFDRYSPHARVRAWRTPTLVIHGEKDYRVPIGEALRLFTTLHKQGVPAELLVFPDEGHWITRPRNAETWYEAIAGWLERNGVGLGG